MSSADSPLGSYTFRLIDVSWLVGNWGPMLSLMQGTAPSTVRRIRRNRIFETSLSEEKIMRITHYSKIQSLMLAAALSIGLGFGPPVSAQVRSYIVDSNGNATDLGTLGGNYRYAQGIND